MPFYQDWTFWSFVAAGLALVLSQMPPVRELLKRNALEIEAFKRFLINHRAGVPSAQLHLIVRNTGGSPLKVKAIELAFERDGQPPIKLAASGYYVNPIDKEAVLFTTFTIQPKGEWGHIINFNEPLRRRDERNLRQLESNLRANIIAKRQELANPDRNVAADDANVEPLIQHTNARLPWLPGDYLVTVQVHTSPEAPGTKAQYRIFVYESDEAELRAYVDGYKYGFGLLIPVPDQPGAILELSKL